MSWLVIVDHDGVFICVYIVSLEESACDARAYTLTAQHHDSTTLPGGSQCTTCDLSRDVHKSLCLVYI